MANEEEEIIWDEEEIIEEITEEALGPNGSITNILNDFSANIDRIVNSLKDIRQAILDKGASPTGLCETFAAAIRSIESGGGAYPMPSIPIASGLSTITASGDTAQRINIGFRPKFFVYVRTSSATSKIPYDVTYLYDADWGEKTYYYTSRTPTVVNFGVTTALTIQTMDDTGVTIRKGSTDCYFRWYAIGAEAMSTTYPVNMSYGTFDFSTNNVNTMINLQTGLDSVSEFVAYNHGPNKATKTFRHGEMICWSSSAPNEQWGARGELNTSNAASGNVVCGTTLGTATTYFPTIEKIVGGVVTIKMPASASYTAGTYQWFAKGTHDDSETDTMAFRDVPNECFFVNQLGSEKTKTFSVQKKPKYIIMSAMSYYNSGTYTHRGRVCTANMITNKAYRNRVTSTEWAYEECTPNQLGLTSITDTSITVYNSGSVNTSFLLMVYY